MINWRPSLAEFTKPFKQPRAWGVSLERYGKGIDNAHLDVFLSPRLREQLRKTARRLILEDVSMPGRRAGEQRSGFRELESFRESYLAMFEATLERCQADASPDLLVLFQVALLKCLLQAVPEANLRLQMELRGETGRGDAKDSGQGPGARESLDVLSREEYAINRRVLHLLFRQLRKLEGSRLDKLRASIAGNAWPLPDGAFFNPVLMIPHLDELKELRYEYPIALLAENGDTNWLFQTNQFLIKVFQYYLPAWTQLPSHHRPGAGNGEGSAPRERLDQGQLRGFVETEILLSGYVPSDEYRQGRCSWLDEPENLRLFLNFGASWSAPAGSSLLRRRRHYWRHQGWNEFQQGVTQELHRCLDVEGLTRSVTLLYWLPTIRSPITRSLPLSLVIDYVEGRLPRRRVAQRLEAMRLGLGSSSVIRVLDRAVAEIKRLPREGYAKYLNRYLVDFLVLRRDLKLAYKTYETMDRIRLVEEPDEVRLSRSNASLIEFNCSDEPGPVVRRIRGHAVIKADVRGSTQMTEQLLARNLNPASHFSLNFFDPVNKLLSEFGAEKVFVEGDAVILAIFEYDDEGAGLAVARACGLAQRILKVVTRQNMSNRQHGLPELELGLGVAYSPQEPNFLYDGGHRIMISGAINRADRLSACSARLRQAGFMPELRGFRVTVVRDLHAVGSSVPDSDLLSFNVNGVKIEEPAFFKLQRELNLRQVKLLDEEAGDTLFFTGRYTDLMERNHRLVVRYGPVREWDGLNLGAVDAMRRHFFEVIVDESFTTRIRQLVRSGAL